MHALAAPKLFFFRPAAVLVLEPFAAPAFALRIEFEMIHAVFRLCS